MSSRRDRCGADLFASLEEQVAATEQPALHTWLTQTRLRPDGGLAVAFAEVRAQVVEELLADLQLPPRSTTRRPPD